MVQLQNCCLFQEDRFQVTKAANYTHHDVLTSTAGGSSVRGDGEGLKLSSGNFPAWPRYVSGDMAATLRIREVQKELIRAESWQRRSSYQVTAP